MTSYDQSHSYDVIVEVSFSIKKQPTCTCAPFGTIIKTTNLCHTDCQSLQDLGLSSMGPL